MPKLLTAISAQLVNPLVNPLTPTLDSTTLDSFMPLGRKIYNDDISVFLWKLQLCFYQAKQICFRNAYKAAKLYLKLHEDSIVFCKISQKLCAPSSSEMQFQLTM